MPFDAMAFNTDPPARAAGMFDLIRHRFMSLEWRWFQGQLTDGKNGHCLLGAVYGSSHECKTDVGFAEVCLFEAITGKRWKKPIACEYRFDITIGQFNDAHSFEEVREVLAEAKQLADADVLPW